MLRSHQFQPAHNVLYPENRFEGVIIYTVKSLCGSGILILEPSHKAAN